MKKQLIYMIIGVILATILVTGATYAFLNAIITSSNNINQTSGNIDIEYQKGESFDDAMELVTSKEDGYVTTVNMRSKNGSMNPFVNIFVQVDEITSNIATTGFKYEVCANRTGDEEVCQNGTFNGVESGSEVTIMNNYRLNQNNTEFTIYLWLSEADFQEGVDGEGVFNGYIGAKSEDFTAKFT